MQVLLRARWRHACVALGYTVLRRATAPIGVVVLGCDGTARTKRFKHLNIFPQRLWEYRISCNSGTLVERRSVAASMTLWWRCRQERSLSVVFIEGSTLVPAKLLRFQSVSHFWSPRTEVRRKGNHEYIQIPIAPGAHSHDTT